MIFRNFPYNLLGSKVRLKIVLHLLAEGGSINEREMGRRLDVSHVAIGKALKDIRTTNLVKCEKIGGSNIYVLNKKSYAFLSLKDITTLASTPPLIDLRLNISRDFGEDQLPKVKKIVLFGSVAGGKETETSDIDLLFLVEREEDKKAVNKRANEVYEFYMERYGNMLSLHVLTENEMKSSLGFMKNINNGMVIR